MVFARPGIHKRRNYDSSVQQSAMQERGFYDIPHLLNVLWDEIWFNDLHARCSIQDSSYNLEPNIRPYEIS